MSSMRPTYGDPEVVIGQLHEAAIDAGRKLREARGTEAWTDEHRRLAGIPTSAEMKDWFYREMRQELAPFVWEGDYA